VEIEGIRFACILRRRYLAGFLYQGATRKDRCLAEKVHCLQWAFAARQQRQ
jgi:hypothetical protein